MRPSEALEARHRPQFDEIEFLVGTGRHGLRQIATVVTPDTILRWHRQLIARKWTYLGKRSKRHGVLAEIRRLARRDRLGGVVYEYVLAA